MFHQNVLPPEQLYSPQTKVPPWQELSVTALSLIASIDVSPQLYSGGETPMSRLIDSGDDISYKEYIWESCRTLCVEALTKQRAGHTMTRLEMTGGVLEHTSADVLHIEIQTPASVRRAVA